MELLKRKLSGEGQTEGGRDSVNRSMSNSCGQWRTAIAELRRSIRQLSDSNAMGESPDRRLATDRRTDRQTDRITDRKTGIGNADHTGELVQVGVPRNSMGVMPEEVRNAPGLLRKMRLHRLHIRDDLQLYNPERQLFDSDRHIANRRLSMAAGHSLQPKEQHLDVEPQLDHQKNLYSKLRKDFELRQPRRVKEEVELPSLPHSRLPTTPTLQTISGTQGNAKLRMVVSGKEVGVGTAEANNAKLTGGALDVAFPEFGGRTVKGRTSVREGHPPMGRSDSSGRGLCRPSARNNGGLFAQTQVVQSGEDVKEDNNTYGVRRLRTLSDRFKEPNMVLQMRRRADNKQGSFGVPAQSQGFQLTVPRRMVNSETEESESQEGELMLVPRWTPARGEEKTGRRLISGREITFQSKPNFTGAKSGVKGAQPHFKKLKRHG